MINPDRKYDRRLSGKLAPRERMIGWRRCGRLQPPAPAITGTSLPAPLVHRLRIIADVGGDLGKLPRQQVGLAEFDVGR
jgi:hypothetical protein